MFTQVEGHMEALEHFLSQSRQIFMLSATLYATLIAMICQTFLAASDKFYIKIRFEMKW